LVAIIISTVEKRKPAWALGVSLSGAYSKVKFLSLNVGGPPCESYSSWATYAYLSQSFTELGIIDSRKFASLVRLNLH